jgi:YD repeat-containing protein
MTTKPFPQPEAAKHSGLSGQSRMPLAARTDRARARAGIPAANRCNAWTVCGENSHCNEGQRCETEQSAELGSCVKIAREANGRLSSKTQISTGAQTGYVYDGLGRLRAVLLPNGTRIDYVLDALGRRIGKVVGGAFVHGWPYGGHSLRPMAQLDASGQIDAMFVYGTHVNVPNSIVAQRRGVSRVDRPPRQRAARGGCSQWRRDTAIGL